MEDAIVVYRQNDIVITQEQFKLISEAVSTQHPTKPELDLYFYDCARRGVHPLDKLIHFTKRQGRYTPIISIDYMRIRAESSGAYAGSDDATFTGTKPDTATVTVWKMVGGMRCPFTATARWAEYAPGDKEGFMWKKMPHTMLAKCAEALALRKAFPGQLSGLYSNDEMSQAGVSLPGVSSDIDAETGEIVDGTATTQPAPGNGNGGQPDAPEPHWTVTQNWKKFYTYATRNLGLSHEEVHEALEVESAKEFTGSKLEASQKLVEYAQMKAEHAKESLEDAVKFFGVEQADEMIAGEIEAEQPQQTTLDEHFGARDQRSEAYRQQVGAQ